MVPRGMKKKRGLKWRREREEIGERLRTGEGRILDAKRLCLV